MAQPVRWSDEALEDLSSIAKFIAKDSPFYAEHVLEEILSKGEAIIHFPESGRVVPEMGNKSIRERFVYSYRLIYQIEDEIVNILAIIHGKRLLENDARFKKI
ncbi:MAG: type II toxin-antitoxin system RelE/ParE family toxin [Gammaproteobacteria bacterium]|jgi:addiction module RelE/StbE family toxin|nr:type II toxin-antitoxin system RelE/ParE family toxin [Candidatus Neomarinimicrobiota bacterium]MBT6651377.1 type II toxin-antitoxin system RelE/ParE family toxin [Gammaproteobacteria bacterium]MBT7478771.1 type II toxin-antitoxin system RelE/ParE family toxin [Gammaproteobacteria bacterium]